MSPTRLFSEGGGYQQIRYMYSTLVPEAGKSRTFFICLFDMSSPAGRQLGNRVSKDSIDNFLNYETRQTQLSYNKW